MTMNLKLFLQVAPVICLHLLAGSSAASHENSWISRPGEHRKAPEANAITTQDAQPLAEFLSEPVGGPHGDFFTDKNFVHIGTQYHAIAFITLAGCGNGEHLRAIKLGFRDTMSTSKDATMASLHGTSADEKNQQKLILDIGEYVNKVELTTYKAKTRFSRSTRVGWARITSNVGVSGSRYLDDQVHTLEYKDYALSYFEGNSGQEVDLLRAHFVPWQTYFQHN